MATHGKGHVAPFHEDAAALHHEHQEHLRKSTKATEELVESKMSPKLARVYQGYTGTSRIQDVTKILVKKEELCLTSDKGKSLLNYH